MRPQRAFLNQLSQTPVVEKETGVEIVLEVNLEAEVTLTHMPHAVPHGRPLMRLSRTPASPNPEHDRVWFQVQHFLHHQQGVS